MSASKIAMLLIFGLMLVSFQNCSNAKFAVDDGAKSQLLGNNNSQGNDPSVGISNPSGNDPSVGAGNLSGNDPSIGSGNPSSNDGSVPGGTTGGNDASTCPASNSSTASTSITVNPKAVCGPSVAQGQSSLPTTSAVVAVLYKSDNFFGGATFVQAWDSPTDVASLRSQLAALKPFSLSLSKPLAPGSYSLVMYDSSKVKAPYSYDWSNSQPAVAPIMDSVAHFLDYTSTFTVDNSCKQSSTQNLAVLVGSQGQSQCQGAGTIDPLTINLSRQPIALSSQQKGVMMDLDGDGTKQQISWFTNPAQNVILVNVSNGVPADGFIGPSLVFGNYTVGPDGQVAENGYDALAKFDSNGDGVIDSKDAIWPNLRVWQDLNRNGVADSGELLTLSQVNIVSIELPRTSTNHIVKESCQKDQYGNVFCKGRGAYVNINSGGKSSRQPMIDIGFKPL